MLRHCNLMITVLLVALCFVAYAMHNNYRRNASLISISSNINSKTLWPNSINRSVLSHFSDQVSVLDYCDPSQINGSTDNAICIQAAQNAICSGRDGKTSGGELYFPTGAYVIRSKTVTQPCPGIHWRGQGYGNFYTPEEYKYGSGALIICQTGDKDCLFWNGGVKANYAAGGGIDNININAEGMNSGAVIHTQFLDHFTARDLHVQAPKIFYFQEAGSNTVLQDININGYRDLAGTRGLIALDSYNGVHCNYLNSDQGNSCRQDRTMLRNIGAGPREKQTGGSGLSITNFVQTVIQTDLNLIGNFDTVSAECSQAVDLRSCPDFIRITRVEAEQCIHTCLNTNDVSDIWVLDSYFNGNDASGASANLVSISCSNFCTASDKTAWGFWMKGTRINNAQASCVKIGIPGFNLIGNTIFGCNMAKGSNARPSKETVAIQIENHTEVDRDKGNGIISDNMLGGSYGKSQTVMDGIFFDKYLKTIVSNNSTSWTRSGIVNN
ncbi:hypothetical protein [Kozakia baliensis]|uniref:hypothetical protein n=1 Tax=Kozakia baliensis TaxID=153496 RepID=UPI0012678EC8|nr:hypothetical protein [Kozakia baliensis]